MTGETPYRVVLLSKASVGDTKREVLCRLAATDGVEIAGIVVEDIIHGSLSSYVWTFLNKIIRRRGRGYPVRAYKAGTDLLGALVATLDAGSSNENDDRKPDNAPLSNVPTVEVSDMLSEHAGRQIKALDPDLGLVWGTRILPPRIFNVPTDGSIGVHTGKIPKCRGGPAGFWELYHGEREAGVTVQELIEELDAGRIVRRETVLIARDDDPADVRARQNEITTDLVVESVRGLANGTLKLQEWDSEKRPINAPPTIPQLARFWIRQRGRRSVKI